jgi:hypothetical protein
MRLEFNKIIQTNDGSRELDAVLGGTVFEAKLHLRDARALRDALIKGLQLVRELDWERYVLILDQPNMTEGRIRAEKELLDAIARRDLTEKIFVVMKYDHKIFELERPLPRSEMEAVREVIEHEHRIAKNSRKRRHGAHFDVLRILMLRWLRREGPITSKELGVLAGVSYPTISTALEQFEPHLKRTSDRSVSLHSLPRNAWMEFVSKSASIRATRFYADRSGRPRPPATLLQKLKDLGKNDIAVGGVLGARHYLPHLDLVGTPRLDLTIHREQSDECITKWVRRLDPGLVPAEPGEPAHLAIHTLFMPRAYFTADAGILWADEVDCMLDLHEARLEQQALEFLDTLTLL